MNLHAAEVMTLIDVDQNVSTGCLLQGTSGIDAVATVSIASKATGMTVQSLRVQRCSAGSLGPVVELPNGWPVPRDAQQFSVEALVPYAQLGLTPTTPARFAFVLLQDGQTPIRIPADGSMLTFGAPSRRRSAAPSLQGAAGAADGNLGEWIPSQQIASGNAMNVWMRAEAEALFLRFDIRAEGPVARDDEYVTPFHSTLTVNAPGVLANDIDPNGDPLSAELVTPATHGTVTLAPDGSFVYQHDGSTTANDAFTYIARDPFAASAPATVTLTPVVISRPPVGSSDSYSTPEDQALVVSAPGVLGNDSDPDGDAITAQIESSPAGGTLSLQANGSFTFTPAANFHGTTSFTYRVSDGTSLSDPVTVTIAVTPINDAPSFTAGGNVIVAEDSGAYAAPWATSISAGPSESSQTVAFQVVGNSNPTLFSVAPSISATGQLAFTPAADANGSAQITVALQDDGGTANGGVDTSATVTFTITVSAVNDSPSFALPASTGSDEDAGARSVPNFASAISAGPADESGQTLTFSVTQASSDPTLTFTVVPAIAADGTLTYTAAPNAYGTAAFNVVLTDNGSNTAPNVSTSTPHSFAITINPINDAPSFTIATPTTASLEDGGPQTVGAFATAISVGPNETGQTLAFSVTPTGSTGTLAFTSAPTIAADGTLTYTAAPNTSGTATFSVVLTDNGSNVAPNVNASAAQTFTITVNAVNDAPSFTIPSSTSADEDAGAQTIPSFATAISAGPADESGQTLTFTVTQTAADPTLTFTVAPAIAADGTLTYTAAPNAYGTATFSVVLTDDGSNTAPNVNTSSTHSFTITINPINDAPSFTIPASTMSQEDGGPQTVSTFATAISAGPNETGQTLTFAVTSTGTTGTLAFTSAPTIAADGTLTYTAASNTSGTATFSVVLTDNGSNVAPNVNASAAQTFTITVNAVNDAPSFTIPSSTSADEDAGAQTIPSFATAISAG
ncbi:MAG: tandem-95 repeat protein, partial [Acidobacteria bacterium]|nr:tandem-95 repeat protein [Acidobacteriota bacterium]